MSHESKVLLAPTRVTAAQRLEFRHAALEALEAAAHRGARSVDIDVSHVQEIDASGLGVLVLLQKRARERGLSTRLLRSSSVVLDVLHGAHLEHLFELES